MCEFDIRLSSVEEVKSFVQVATVQPFEVYVTTPRQTVSAKSFMGMFSLDFRYPLRVMANCTQEELRHFWHGNMKRCRGYLKAEALRWPRLLLGVQLLRDGKKSC